MNNIVPLLYDFFVTKLPYITIFIFVLGVVLRLRRWFSAPRDPEREKIDLVSSIKYIILDVVLFRKTFKYDKINWLIVFLFHTSVAGILFGHLRGFKVWSATLFDPLGEWMAEFMVHTLPIYVGYVFIITQLLLLIRRFRLEKQQLVSLPNDYIAMILLLIKSILGQGMRLLPSEAATTTHYVVTFIPKLVVLHLESVPNYHWFYLHVLFTQLFIMYLPFSKLVHIFSGVISPAIYGSRRKQLEI
jgi:nitrate reductase gamma subunit